MPYEEKVPSNPTFTRYIMASDPSSYKDFDRDHWFIKAIYRFQRNHIN